jgi:hypothetical protein
MARYGKIETGFWHSPKIRRLSQEAKYLMLYLLSCPHGNAIGCFVLHDGYITADLRWSNDAVGIYVQELVENGLVERDLETSLLRIVGWWGHNAIENPNVAKHVAKEIAALPACPVKDHLIEALFMLTGLLPSVMQILSEGLAKPFPNGSGRVVEPFRNQEPNLTFPNTSETSAPARVSAASADTRIPKKERGTRIKPDWRPDDEDWQFACSLGFTDAQIEKIFPRFVDYWIAKVGAGAVKHDWSATWRNWMRKESEQRQESSGVTANPAPASIDWDRCVADYQASKGTRWPHRQLGPEPGYSGCRAPPGVLERYGFTECQTRSTLSAEAAR